MDPTRPLAVTVRIDSPQAVAYRLWFRQPEETDWTAFATGDDQSPNPSTYSVGPLPRGSVLRYFALISGNPQTAYRLELVVAQGGAPLQPPLLVAGTTDGDGTASEGGEVEP